MSTLIAIEYGGYVYASYAVALVAIGGFTWRVLRRGRQLADQVDDADKYWH
ncbi:MAG TPA: heme exporter protein CcmD [Ilumatobacter sp.]|nr:heme exporter protein CcmD [Ilumatobacter sp.]